MKGRDEYVKWDININERKDIVSRLKEKYIVTGWINFINQL